MDKQQASTAADTDIQQKAERERHANAWAAECRVRWERGARLHETYDGGPVVERPVYNSSDRG